MYTVKPPMRSQKCQKYYFINVWRKSVFDIYFTELGAALTAVLPVLFKYCVMVSVLASSAVDRGSSWNQTKDDIIGIGRI
jgi:hypothetical protein